MEVYEFKGLTKEDAIVKAESELGLDREALEIETEIASENKTMFSILDTNRVTIKVKVIEDKVYKNRFSKKEIEDAKEKLIQFLDDLAKLYNDIDFRYDIQVIGRKIYVDIDNNQKPKWIGYQGKILDTIQKIINAIAISDKSNVKIYINIGKYKQERKRALENIAKKNAEKAIALKKEIRLKPMNSYERKIVHAALQDYEIKTESEGQEPKRYVVIKPI